MADNDSTRLARMEANIMDLVEWRRSHDDNDNRRFDQQHSYFKEGFERMDERFDKIENQTDDRFDKLGEKMETLWDANNQAKGASGFKKALITGVLSLLAVLAGYFSGNHQ